MSISVETTNNSNLRSSSKTNSNNENGGTIVAVVDVDEFTSKPPFELSSKQARSKVKSRHKVHEDEQQHENVPLAASSPSPKPPKQRKSKLIIPKTLIVTDSDAVVIDNIDLNNGETISVSNEMVLMPSQMNLLSNAGGGGDKKRSDSKSSSLRDNTSVIFSNALEMGTAMDGGEGKFPNYGCCCMCSLLKKLVSCRPSSSKQFGAHLSTGGGVQIQTGQQSLKKAHTINGFASRFFVEMRRCLVGNLVALSVAISFVVANYLTRRTFNSLKLSRLDNASLTFDSLGIETSETKHRIDCEFCFSLVWLASSSLVFAYPVYAVFWMLARKIRRPNKSLRLASFFFSSLNVFKTQPVNNYKKIPFDSNKSERGQAGHEKKPAPIYLKRNYYLKLAGVTTLWIASGYLYLRAIDLLYCLDVIILFSINYSFIYMIKWIILHHKFIPLRLLGFILSIASLIFMFYSDGFSFNLKFLGNFCITGSSVGSSILQIIWELNTSEKKNHQRIMFLSLIGSCSFLCAWPLVLALEFSFVRQIFTSLPHLSQLAQESIISLLVACLLAFVHMMLFKFGAIFTKESFLHIGSILAIPFAFTIDVKFNNISLSSLKIGAFICVCVGYVFLIVRENLYSDMKKYFFPHEATDINNVNNSLTRKYHHPSRSQQPTTSPHHLQNLFGGKLSNT